MLARIFVSLFAAIFASLGLWSCYTGIQAVIEAAQSENWPAAEGRIISSHVATSVSHGRHGGTSYTPAISYTYLAGGTSFTGSVVAPGRNWGSRSAYAAVHRFPAGSAALVRYCATDPSRSVLDAGLHGYNFGQLLLGVMMTCFALLAVLIIFNTAPGGGRTSTLRRDSPGGRLILPLVGLFFAVLLTAICLN